MSPCDPLRCSTPPGCVLEAPSMPRSTLREPAARPHGAATRHSTHEGLTSRGAALHTLVVSGKEGRMDIPQERKVVTEIPGPRSGHWFERRGRAVAAGVANIHSIVTARASGAIIEDVDGNRLN